MCVHVYAYTHTHTHTPSQDLRKPVSILHVTKPSSNYMTLKNYFLTFTSLLYTIKVKSCYLKTIKNKILSSGITNLKTYFYKCQPYNLLLYIEVAWWTSSCCTEYDDVLTPNSCCLATLLCSLVDQLPHDVTVLVPYEYVLSNVPLLFQSDITDNFNT